LNVSTTQFHLSNLLDKIDLARYLASRSGQADRARMLSLQLPHALDALNVAPDASQNMKMENLICVAYFLFVLGRCEHAGATCPVCTRETLDRSGHHAVAGCPRGRHRVRRHNGLSEIVGEHLALADFTVTKDRAIVIDANNPPRPADLLVTRFINGQDVALDVSVTSPLQSQLLSHAAREQGHAIKLREAQKRTKYEAACLRQDVVFLPIVAETYGGWSEVATTTFERIIMAEAAELNKKSWRVRRRFYGRLSVSMAIHSARAILDRRPPRLERLSLLRER
jgi:hypothetical protein